MYINYTSWTVLSVKPNLNNCIDILANLLHFFLDQFGKLWNYSKGELHVKVVKIQVPFNSFSENILGVEEW